MGGAGKYIEMDRLDKVVNMEEGSRSIHKERAEMLGGAIDTAQADKAHARLKRMAAFDSHDYDPADNDLEEDARRARKRADYKAEEQIYQQEDREAQARLAQLKQVEQQAEKDDARKQLLAELTKKYKAMNMKELRQECINVGIKKERVGWPTCCPTSRPRARGRASSTSWTARRAS